MLQLSRASLEARLPLWDTHRSTSVPRKGKPLKTALIAAVVAAIVAAASGTAATIVVTSKNIKNGTIQTVT
jgi:hypothetical protein